MSLYSLSGDFYTPIGLNFSNIENFNQQCVDCYYTVIQLGQNMELCDNNRYTSTCPYLSNCEKSCFKKEIKSQLSPGELYCSVDLTNIASKCKNTCFSNTTPQINK